MSDIPNLHYIDIKRDELISVPYNRSRAMSVSPLFYENRVAGLIALKELITDRINGNICKIMEIEKEIARIKNQKI